MAKDISITSSIYLKCAFPVAIVSLFLFAYFSGFSDYFSLDAIRKNHSLLHTFIIDNPVLAPLCYIALFTTALAISLPCHLFFTLIAGFLFPQPYSTIYAVIAATIGTTAIFFISRTTLGVFLHRRAHPFLEKVENNFKSNAASYLLFLRFVPILPFWVLNLTPGIFGIPLFTVIWTTFIGIIPGSFILTEAGAGLDILLEKGGDLSIDMLLTTKMKITFALLGICALIPVVIKKIRKNTERANS